MNALPNYDSWKTAAPNERDRASEDAPIIEAMREDADTFAEFIGERPEQADVLRKMIQSGLPRGDLAGDSLRIIGYVAQLEAIEAEFTQWVYQRSAMRSDMSNIELWLSRND